MLKIVINIIGFAIMAVGVYLEVKTCILINKNPKHDAGEACLSVFVSLLPILIGATLFLCSDIVIRFLTNL
jgi:hypothetical protein